jgi:hypothetical protein
MFRIISSRLSIEVFGTNMIWMKKEDVLMVCGGADWKRAYQK